MGLESKKSVFSITVRSDKMLPSCNYRYSVDNNSLFPNICLSHSIDKYFIGTLGGFQIKANLMVFPDDQVSHSIAMGIIMWKQTKFLKYNYT